MSVSEIILTTHNRHTYLELTLNALLYSLSTTPEAKVHIFMSAPTTKVKEVCYRKAIEHPQIKLYLIPQNVVFAAANLAVQLLIPQYITLWEDDFIIPQHTNTLLPAWNREFVRQLQSGIEVVSFTTSIENISSGFLSWIRDDYPLWSPKKFKWLNNIPKETITGNGMTVTLATYLAAVARGNSSKFATPYYFASDHFLYDSAKSRQMTSIRGYHIGANQEMDGFPNPADRTRFPAPEDNQEVHILETGEIRHFKLSAILNMKA